LDKKRGHPLVGLHDELFVGGFDGVEFEHGVVWIWEILSRGVAGGANVGVPAGSVFAVGCRNP
jgi:hypothetical protein